jgi:predicted MFS family arabinose efflux permease
MPTRQAVIAEVVPQDDLMSGIVLQQFAFQLTRIAGPAAAALLFSAAGLGPLFLVTTIGLALSAAAMWCMRTELLSTPAQQQQDSVRAALWRGLLYASAASEIRLTLGLLAGVATFGMSFQTVLPIFATETLNLAADAFGTLLAVMGLGAVAAALPAAGLGHRNARAIMWMAAIGLGLMVSLTAAVRMPLATYVSMAVIGFLFIIVMSTANMTIQSTVPHSLRGRVMGLYIAAFFGGSAGGGVVIGMLAESIGVNSAMLICGLVVAAIGAVVGWNQRAER